MGFSRFMWPAKGEGQSKPRCTIAYALEWLSNCVSFSQYIIALSCLRILFENFLSFGFLALVVLVLLSSLSSFSFLFPFAFALSLFLSFLYIFVFLGSILNWCILVGFCLAAGAPFQCERRVCCLAINF